MELQFVFMEFVSNVDIPVYAIILIFPHTNVTELIKKKKKSNNITF